MLLMMVPITGTHDDIRLSILGPNVPFCDYKLATRSENVHKRSFMPMLYV